MSESFSLETLSERINAWCEEHAIAPASGQAGEVVSERSIRYYRTLGLIDAPEGGGYGEKHLLQLTAVRLLQAQGLPLRRIRELVYGRSLAELREIRQRGLAEAQRATAGLRVSLPVQDELWRIIPLDGDFLLVSRRGTSLTPLCREAVLLALRTNAGRRVGFQPTSRSGESRSTKGDRTGRLEGDPTARRLQAGTTAPRSTPRNKS